ncbi:zinc ribbon domain-containing protein [Halomicroarcula sp. GCM10025324]|uniref:zinc ribbon domain-containing protein n=1 Tax=Haloarcula TaxID=2237 RepID=UPI0023E81B31|nr:zinc ribbon domain-containing protein [Halomicroarcula sp. ZS-22-S1]
MTSTTPFTTDAIEEFAPGDERRKTVLFCPDCGHESELDGDWHTEGEDGRERLRCPVCRTVVSSQ